MIRFEENYKLGGLPPACHSGIIGIGIYEGPKIIFIILYSLLPLNGGPPTL